MSCPDLHRIIAFHKGGKADPEMAAHLAQCATCAADLRIIRELPAALALRAEVPEALVDRVMAALPDASPAIETPGTPPLQLFITAFLGFLCSLASLFVTGTLGGEGFGRMLVFCLLVGLGAMAVEFMRGRIPEGPEGPPPLSPVST